MNPRPVCKWTSASLAALFGVMMSGCETAAVKPAPTAASHSDSSGSLNPFTDERVDQVRVPILEIARVSIVPAVRNRVDVRYPTAMRRKGIQGEAMVDFVVDEEGSAREVHAIKATNNEFAAAAVVSVAQWKFRPGEKDGQIVRTHMQVPVSFTLNEP